MQFFNPFVEIRQTENRLPQWQQQNAVLFVTFRLADALPSQLLHEWENERTTWINLHQTPWDAETELEYHKRFSGTIERWLDAGHGSCVSRQSSCARIVDETLRHFDGDRLALISSVVMPNHVHVLFVQNLDHPLETCCVVGKLLPLVRSTLRCSVPGLCGNAIILTG
jgi:hypothetical protein